MNDIDHIDMCKITTDDLKAYAADVIFPALICGGMIAILIAGYSFIFSNLL